VATFLRFHPSAYAQLSTESRGLIGSALVVAVAAFVANHFVPRFVVGVLFSHDLAFLVLCIRVAIFLKSGNGIVYEATSKRNIYMQQCFIRSLKGRWAKTFHFSSDRAEEMCRLLTVKRLPPASSAAGVS
jgi:hypothetical protein